MCDGSITTMVSNQNRIRYCWIVYSNSQTNERLSTTESKTNAIASTSNSSHTLTTSNSLNTTNFTKNSSNPSTKENAEASNDDEQREQQKTKAGAEDSSVDDDDLASVHLMLEPHLRPAPPDPNSDLSKQIFDEHKQLAKEYLKIHTEIAYVTKHRDEILSKMDTKERQERLELCNKLMEKEELLKFQANLKRQLELIRLNTRPPHSTPNNLPPPPVPSTSSGPTVSMPMPTAPPYDRQNSNSSTTANDDGWVLVPSTISQTESDA